MEQINTQLPYNGFMESRIGGRSQNQDYLDAKETAFGLLVIVCDGMGGGPAGQVASKNAVEAIVRYVESHESGSLSTDKLLHEAISEANRYLINLQKNDRSLIGMGTTVVAILINKTCATVAHVGDSRIYQLRFGGKQFRTTDHSQVMEQVLKGNLTEEEARTAPNSNVITRALGIYESIKVDVQKLPYEKGDIFVLCTDGVWGTMPEKELIKLLGSKKSLSGLLEQAMIRVEDLGLESGGKHDNFTLALIETKNNSIQKETMTHRTRNILYTLSILCGISLIMNIVLGFMLKPSTNQPDQNVPTSAEEQINTSPSSNTEDSLRMEMETMRQEFENRIKDLNKQFDEKIEDLRQIDSQEKWTETLDQQHELNIKKEDLVNKIDTVVSKLQAFASTTSAIEKKKIDQAKKDAAEIVRLLKEMQLPEMAVTIQKDVCQELEKPICREEDTTATRKRLGEYKTIIRTLNECKSKIQETL